jgi:hypothetical protein
VGLYHCVAVVLVLNKLAFCKFLSLYAVYSNEDTLYIFEKGNSAFLAANQGIQIILKMSRCTLWRIVARRRMSQAQKFGRVGADLFIEWHSKRVTGPHNYFAKRILGRS